MAETIFESVGLLTTSSFSNEVDIFTVDTRTAFSQHLLENPNNRRVSQSEKAVIIEWLTNRNKRPSSQEEFSRRNYIQKTFSWDENSQTLLAVAKQAGGQERTVITTDLIADVVGILHKENGHAGWDPTWKDVRNSYYGILRADVIFLLKRCPCAQKPTKRPKGATARELQCQQTDHEVIDFTNTGDGQSDISGLGVQKNDKYGGG
ncbi:hypothetical protein G7Y89_g10421 [Cudoniella acicularis]|uniref:Uncharacterized protein n=1 Tax=Cudoniella acicularis TaxID=354080 RepID=A0A8H4RFK1_9HELO|nr:hypothetical protein G7Y89_g10421 [Cudoniella acicularis]